jgi:hypothetical protein
MPQRDLTASRSAPRWYEELNLGVGLIVFATATVYPWFGTTSGIAIVVGVCLAIPGVLIFLHSVRLGRRRHWQWVKTDAGVDRVGSRKERATYAAAIALLMLAAVYASLDFSGPTLALRSGWPMITGGCVVFAFLIFVAWRARSQIIPVENTLQIGRDRGLGMGAPSDPLRARRIRQLEARTSLRWALAFFIMGLSVVISFDRDWGFAPYAWVTIPTGVTIGVAILFADRKWTRAPRPCPGCRQQVRWDAEKCQFCGTQIP